MTPQKPVRTGKTVPAPPPQRVCVGDGGGGEEPGHPLLLDLSSEVPPPNCPSSPCHSSTAYSLDSGRVGSSVEMWRWY